ncbi:MAG: HupE/UreJ family protein [Vitreoscilla sp.]|nr:HupE/UreJ family protein [Vitreoscilla sp.]
MITATITATTRHLVLGLALATAAAAALAHAPSNATLELRTDDSTVHQRWDIALRDLDRVLPLDADDDGRITAGELRAAWGEIGALADAGLALTQADGACRPGPIAEPQVEAHADGSYAVLRRDWQCPASGAAVHLDYRLFADADASHRGLLRWQGSHTAVLTPGAGLQALPTAAGGPSSFGSVVAEGVHHILIGTDHVLFLLALLLPSVMAAGRAGVGAARWWPVAGQVAQVVTAFTVAHSVTLALAVLGWVNPPSRLVESLIAASVVLAAIDNLRPFLPFARWKLAFTFGLVHGFGFAGALEELGLDRSALGKTLLGFNLGVELGQLAIVAVALPLAWWLRGTLFYRRGVLAGGSVAIAAVAGLWFVERAFDLSLIT